MQFRWQLFVNYERCEVRRGVGFTVWNASRGVMCSKERHHEQISSCHSLGHCLFGVCLGGAGEGQNETPSFRSKERLSKQRIKEEVVRKARRVLKGAVLAA